MLALSTPTTAVATATITVLPKPVTFTLGEQAFDYDGTVKTVTVTPSDPAATWRVATGTLSGTEPGSTPFSVEATGNYAGTADGTLVIRGSQVEVTAFSPAAASYTVMEGPAAGHTYPRSWNEGSAWFAYLARSGVRLEVAGRSATSAIDGFEIQAQSPGRDWFTLISGAPSGNEPNGPGNVVRHQFDVTLGEGRADKPIIPSDLSLAGAWKLRARVHAASGKWSEWAFEQPLEVLLPLKSVALTGRTLPPIQDAAWFQTSPYKQYNLSVWIP